MSNDFRSAIIIKNSLDSYENNVKGQTNVRSTKRDFIISITSTALSSFTGTLCDWQVTVVARHSRAPLVVSRRAVPTPSAPTMKLASAASVPVLTLATVMTASDQVLYVQTDKACRHAPPG